MLLRLFHMWSLALEIKSIQLDEEMKNLCMLILRKRITSKSTISDELAKELCLFNCNYNARDYNFKKVLGSTNHIF